jgi:hypothetical protein
MASGDRKFWAVTDAANSFDGLGCEILGKWVYLLLIVA